MYSQFLSFRDGLFKAAELSVPVTLQLFGRQHHYMLPLRDESRRVIQVLDLDLAENSALPPFERRQLIQVVQTLQSAFREITSNSFYPQETILPGN